MFKFESRSYLPVLVLCIAVFAYYQILIYASPTIYWDDPHIRWALRDQIILGRWLPVIQVFVVLSAKITPSLYFLKTVMSFLAIASLVSAYGLARYLFSASTGLLAVVLLAFNCMFAALAIVPYADTLFIGLAFLAFSLLDEPQFTRRFYFGLVVLNLAALTRYAGWFLSMIFMVEVALRSFGRMNWKSALWQTLKIAGLCSLAPLAWLIFGVSESGNVFDRLWSIFEFVAAPASQSLSEHLRVRLNPAHIQGFFSQYLQLLRQQAGIEFLILGTIGFLAAISNRLHRVTHFRIASFLVLDLCVLVFLHPWKFGNLRQPFLMQAFIVLYAAHGLAQGISRLLQRRSLNSENWRNWAIVLSVIILSVRLIPSSGKFVLGNLRAETIVTTLEIGAWLTIHLKAEDAVLVLDDTDYYPYALATYMKYPLARILDDRLDLPVIRESLRAAQMVYVIEFYTSRGGLSPIESRVLKDLESGQIQAERSVFGAVNVWYAPANQINYSP